MSITLKFYFDDEIRRSTVDEHSLVSLDFLSTKLRSMAAGVDVFGSVAVYWMDPEGDRITISCDEDVTEAVRCLAMETAGNSGKVLRLYGMNKKRSLDGERPRSEGCRPRHCRRGWRSEQTAEAFAENGEQKKEAELHVGISCDGCNGEVRGYRYKCMGCADFDLCSLCEGKHLHDQHPMIRIANPSDHSWRAAFGRRGFGCPMGNGPFAGLASESVLQQVIENAAVHAAAMASATGRPGAGAAAADAQWSNEAGANILATIGESVAAVLSGLGIDVDVDVHHNGKRQKVTTPRSASVPEEQQVPASRQSDEAPKQSFVETTAETNTAWLNELHLMDQQESLPTETQNAAALITPTHTDADKVGDSRGVEWTFVECPTAVAMSSNTGALYPTAPVATATAPAVVQVQHKNPAVRSSLQQLLEMGFGNEGGWLTALVESKHGEINAVLDALKPIPRHY